MNNIAQQVMGLRQTAESLRSDTVRLQTLFDASEQRLGEVRARLVELGYGPDGLEAQIEARAAELKRCLMELNDDLADLRREAM